MLLYKDTKPIRKKRGRWIDINISNCSTTNIILVDPNLTLLINAVSTGWVQVRAIRACLRRLGQNERIAPSFVGLRQDMWSPEAFMLNRGIARMRRRRKKPPSMLIPPSILRLPSKHGTFLDVGHARCWPFQLSDQTSYIRF